MGDLRGGMVIKVVFEDNERRIEQLIGYSITADLVTAVRRKTSTFLDVCCNTGRGGLRVKANSSAHKTIWI